MTAADAILSILLQFLKRKEREFEHEMERLAKEKIAAQNRILLLKRELAQWDIDFTKLLPEPMDVGAVKSERSGEMLTLSSKSTSNDYMLRTEPSNDVSGKTSLMYSSTSSLSSLATTTSPACSGHMTNVSCDDA